MTLGLSVSLSQLEQSFVMFFVFLFLICSSFYFSQPIIHNAKITELRKNSKLIFAGKSFGFVPYYIVLYTIKWYCTIHSICTICNEKFYLLHTYLFLHAVHVSLLFVHTHTLCYLGKCTKWNSLQIIAILIHISVNLMYSIYILYTYCT